MLYNRIMSKEVHLPSKLSRILCAIEGSGILKRFLPGGCFWDAYTDACADYSVHGLDMSDMLAQYHIPAIKTRLEQAGCELPSPLKV